MTDRPDPRPPDDNDDDLAYLDAGLPDEDHDADAPLAPAEDEPVRRVVTAPAREVGTATTPPIEFEAASDRTWFWPMVSAIGLVVVVTINYLANALEFNDQSTGDVVNKDPVPFQPAGWVFSIWGVIYLLLAAFVIYGLIPAGRRNVRLQRIGPFFLVANIANATWIVLWHWEQFLASLVTIVVLLVSLLAIYLVLRLRNPIRRSIPPESPTLVQRLVLWLPFSIYLGWILVATLSNVMVWMDRSGRGGGPFSLNTWAVLFMLAATVVAGVFAFAGRDAVIPLVLAVAFAGITQHAWGDSMLVSISAAIFAALNVVLAGVASMITYDMSVRRTPFGTIVGNEEPPSMTAVEGDPSQRS